MKLILLLLLPNFIMAQVISTKDEIILNNLKIINLATLEKNTLNSKMIDNDFHIVEYNSDGNPTSFILKNSKKTEKTFKYDSLYRLIEMKYGNTFYYKYNSHNQLKQVLIDNNTVYFEYEYDTLGNIIIEKKRNKLGLLNIQRENFYDGNILKWTKYYNVDMGHLSLFDKFEYTKSRKYLRKTTESYQQEKLSFISTIDYSYDQEDNLSTLSIFHNNNLVKREHYCYDRLNNLITETVFDFVFEEKNVRNFTYLNSKLFRERQLRFDKRKVNNSDSEILISDNYIEYYYDKYGNNTDIVYKNSNIIEENRAKYKFLYLNSF